MKRQDLGIQSLVLLTAGLSVAATQVDSIDFKVENGSSQITLSGDHPIAYEKSENAADQQIVLELKDAQLVKNAKRKLDTSSFQSPVKLISPYQLAPQGSEPNARLVIQLRSSAQAEIAQDANMLKITIPGGSAAESAPTAEAPATPANEPPPAVAAEGTTPESKPSEATLTKSIAVEEALVDESKIPKTQTQKRLDDFLTNRGSRPFTGRPISLHLKDADLNDVFRLIADASGFNIVIGDDVKGKVTLELVDVPWDQVLTMIFSTYQLGGERNNNVLRIVTLANQMREKQQEQQTKAAIEANAPRVTKVFKLSFAKLEDIQGIISRFGSLGPGGTATAGSTLNVQADNRTNQLIVRDIPDNIDRIDKLIKILDTQPPQVLIESKVVEVTENFSRNMNGQIGIGRNVDLDTSGSFGAAYGGINTTTGINGGSIGAMSNTTTAAIGGTFPSFGVLTGGKLAALLQLGELESEVHVITSPRAVVMNREQASIVQQVPIAVRQVVTNSGVTTETFNFLNAEISLKVTPTVTNDGSVQMDLAVNRGVPIKLGEGLSAVAPRSVTTKVIVDSGSTLVLGGIYTASNSHTNNGVPWFRKIPIIGYFFSSDSTSDDKSELFFFITPRILNEKESGIELKTDS